MSPNLRDAVAAQRRYYTETASRYDEMHAHENDNDPWNFRFIVALLRMIGAESVLDVGSGTGRGIQRLQSAIPDSFICGAEPVAALIDQAKPKMDATTPSFVQASGEALPFPDDRCDAVCSFAMLHHVPKPTLIVGEMLRVARKAVLILDSNRFGQGRWPVRAAKLLLYKMRVWPLINFAKTRGKGYMFTEGDGVAYSYSAYDSFDQIANWADRLIVIPSEAGKPGSWLHPLLTTRGIVLGAFKDLRS
jgi:ubiquinone/menaquinone biosynthesis C-methylase UbiE